MSDDEEKKKFENEADVLYQAALNAQEAAGVDEKGKKSKVFSQQDLVELSESKDNKTVSSLIANLANANLFRTLKGGGTLAWSVRSRQAARQIKALDRDEKAIYAVIEEAFDNGIWSRDVKKKTSLAQNVVMKAINKMEKSNLIKSVKSVKSPAQRTYMLAHLMPSEEVTGNSFYDAGDLDEAMRDVLLNVIILHVRGLSWYENKKRHKREPSASADATLEAGKKRKRTTDIEDVGQRVKPYSRFDESDFTQLTYRAGLHPYPTAEDIHKFIVDSGVAGPIKSATLTVPEIQGLIDVLIWDEKLEKVPNPMQIATGYRTVRGVYAQSTEIYNIYEDRPGNGFTQAPCGRCPVFDLCSENGPVNPQDCVYFTAWLEKGEDRGENRGEGY